MHHHLGVDDDGNAASQGAAVQVQPVPEPLASQEQANEIMRLGKLVNKTPQEICEAMKVKRLHELTFRQASQVVGRLNVMAQAKKDDDADTNENDTELVAGTQQQQNLRLQILRDLLFTLPAIHWSLPNWDTNPWLSEPIVNTLMWLESVVCMYQGVKSFQQQ